MTVPELKDILRRRGLQVGGLKENLVEKIEGDKSRAALPERCCEAIRYATARKQVRLDSAIFDDQDLADKWIARALSGTTTS